jgi:hypothetical protein
MELAGKGDSRRLAVIDHAARQGPPAGRIAMLRDAGEQDRTLTEDDRVCTDALRTGTFVHIVQRNAMVSR